MQESVMRAAVLRKNHKIALNTDNDVNNLHEAQWLLTVHLEGQQPRFSRLQKLLVVTLVRAFSFEQHVASHAVKSLVDGVYSPL